MLVFPPIRWRIKRFLIQKVENLLPCRRLVKEPNEERSQSLYDSGTEQASPEAGGRIYRARLGGSGRGDRDRGLRRLGERRGTINLVAYSTPQQAYEDKLEPAFKDTSAGDGVDFSNSFGASGDQSRAVESGQPADVVMFSLEPDMTRLVDAGIVGSDWSQNQYKGIVTNSVVTLMVRPGNPKNIHSFDDLTRDDVEVIDPNPATSGGARWNIMAIYGSQINQGKSEAQAQDFVKQVIANTSVQDDSARDSLNTFSSGKGDVLVGYENEAIQAQQEGIDLDYVTPDSTILIENPIAATKDAPSGPEVPRFPLHRPGAAGFRGRGLSTGREVGIRQERRQVPGPVRPLHDRRLRRLVEGLRSVLRGQRLGGQGRGRPREPDQLASERRMASADTAVARPPRAGLRAPLGGAALARGTATLWISLIVLLPLAAVVTRGFEDGLGHFWDSITAPEAQSRDQADADHLADRRRDQRRDGNADRLGAGPRRVPGQAHRQLGDRSALRAADDRGRPDTAGAIRAELASWRPPRLHPGRHRRRAALRDPAIRGAGRPAGADRAGQGDGGGSRLARRSQPQDLPQHHPAQPDSRDRRRLRRWRSRARSASSAPWCC